MFSSLAWSGRKLGLIGVGLLVVLGIVWFALPAPHAEGGLKGHTVNMSRNGAMRVIFDRRMNHGSVEQAFRITPTIDGVFSWQDNQLTFTPKTLLEKGSTYEVTVSVEAKSFFWKPLEEVYRQSFTISDYPEVSVAAPVDGSVMMQDQILTVLFDHPLRNLTGDLKVPEFLQITPSVNGRYHWLGTSGFEFVLEDGWTAATKFTVTVPKGTKMADGGSTIEDKTWSFSTPALSVSLVSPTVHHHPKDPVRFTFNYPVKPDVIAGALTILENETKLSGSEWSVVADKDDAKVMLVTRKGDYPLGKKYTFKFAKDFRADLGPLGLTNDFEATVTMDELGLRVIASSPPEKMEKEVHQAVLVCLNNKGDEKTFAEGIQITPTLKDKQISEYGYMPDTICPNQEAVMSISGNWKPSTEYTITFGGKLADMYGQMLPKSHVLTFKTRPFAPSLEVSTYSDYGVLASHLPRVYQLRALNWENPVTVALGVESTTNLDKSTPVIPKGKKTYDTKGTLNQYKIIEVNLDEIAGEKLPNGFYQVLFENVQIATRHLMITDTALTLKRDREGNVLIWATDMKTGDVVAGMDVEIWSGIGQYDRSVLKKLMQGKTDAEGIARLQVDGDTKLQGLMVKASLGARLGYVETDWIEGIAPWNYGLEKAYSQSNAHHIGHAYTERRIYRPDQQVFFKGVIRLDNDARLSIPIDKDVQVNITDPSGVDVFSQKLSLSDFGTFNASFQLDPSMKLGAYRLAATMNADAQETRVIETTFDVREYRRPDFKVEAVIPAEGAFAGQKIEIPITAAYYHGVPLAGANARFEVTRSKLYFQPMQGRWWNEWYSFSEDENTDCYWYCQVEGGVETVQSGEARVDDQGKFVITIPANLTDFKSSATYMVDVTVTDVNQRQVSSRTEFSVHKGEFYLGVRSDYSGGWDAANADFDVVSVDVDGSPRTNVVTEIKLFRRTWNTAQKVGTDGASFFEWQKTDALLETRALTTDGEGKGRISFAPKEDGEYVVVVSSRDANGRSISAATTRYVYRGGESSVRVSDDHQMKIVQNKASYEVGETASLAVQTPYQNTKALVTIERNSIREHRVIDLGTKKRTVDLKITDADTPNVYVSVLVPKGGGANGIPEFRLGYAHLQVSTTKKILQMTVTPEKATYRPGESVTLVVDTKRSDGTPVPAEVSIAVVDERVIALLGAIDKNMLGKFWFPRWLGVDTAQSLTMLVKKIFFATEGGSGGKGDGGAPAIRGNFRDTAYWNASVVTGADGKVRVTFTLPDNLTSWNVLAMGETKDTVVGHAESKIITKRELMAEPLFPRILRHQDTATLGATLVNATDRAMEVEANMTAEGLSIESATRKVRLEPSSRAVVTWTARVPRTGASTKIKVRVKGGGFEDGFDVTLPVLDFSVPEIVSTSGLLEKNVTETVEIPEDVMPNVGQIDVSVQPNIGNGLQSSINYITHYPYGCAEQKTSALLGNLVYREVMNLKVSKEDRDGRERAEGYVRESIKILVSTQKGDGGWGFWPDYERSYPWLTGYVFWGLTQAEKAGFAVDEGTLDRADKYLRRVFEQADTTLTRGLVDSERAQVLFMLSERNVKDLNGYAATLYEHRDQLSSFAKLFLSMAYANLEPNKTSARAVQLLNDVRNKVIYLNPSTAYVKEEEGYESLLSSDLRTSSLYLQALLRLDPKHEDVERVLRYIVENRKDGYWHNTHDTTMTLLGVVEYVRTHPVNQAAQIVSLYLDNQLKETMKFEEGDVSAAQKKTLSLAELSAKGVTHQFGLEKDSDTRYFYDLSMKVYREIQNIDPFENGMSVIADVYTLADRKQVQALKEVKQGENVRVRIKLLVPKRRRYVALEYHLPAGLEAIDFQLKTSPQNIAGEERQCYPDWQGKLRCLGEWERHWWWENVWTHIEYRDDRVFLFAENLEPGVYEYNFIVQATTPGDYRIPPARAYEFYNPSANAHNEGKVLKVLAR